MGNHNPSVAGNMQVKFNNPEAEVCRRAECLQGIFRKEQPAAPVGLNFKRPFCG